MIKLFVKAYKNHKKLFIVGLATGMVPLYISEIAPKHIRGALGVVNQLAITIG